MGRALRGPLGVLAAILLVDAVVFVAGVLNEPTGFSNRFFDLEEEANLPTWVSTLQLAGIALVAGVYGLLSRGRVRLAMAAFVVIFAFLSLDEFGQVHEEVISRVTGSSSADPWYWPALYSPLALVLAAGTVIFVAEHKRVLGSLLAPVAALGVLVAPVALDSAATQIKDVPVLLPIAVTLEEALELCAAAFMIFVLLRMIESRVRWQRIDPVGRAAGAHTSAPLEKRA